MACFDSQNGWIQFVFANEQDTYYLPSLMKVGFYRYLLYCLKKAGYEAVYFWGEYEGKYELSYMDAISAQYYEKIRPKGLFEKILGGQAGVSLDENEWTSVQAAPDIMEKLFYGIAGGKKKTALVVPMTVFDQFFSANGRTELLLERNRRQSNSGNMVLLTASVRAEESNTCLIRENGILQALFEEVRQAAVPDGIWNLYEKLKDNLNERCIYLNELSIEVIRSIVRKNCIFEGWGMIPVSGDWIDKVADVVDWYYHSEVFRRNTPILLPENKKREYQVIDKSLQNQGTCNGIVEWIKQTGADMSAGAFRSYLRSNYPRDGVECHICTDSFLLRQWDQLTLPVNAPVQLKKEWQNRMDRSRRLLMIVVLRGDESLDRDNLDTCIDQLRRSLAGADTDTFGYGLKAMGYLLDTCYEQTEARKNIWNFYKKIFELSEEIQRLDRELENYNGKILSCRSEMYELFGQIDELEKRSGTAGDSGELDILRRRAIQCNEDIEMLMNLSTLNSNRRFESRQVIASIEQAILGAAGGQPIDVQLILEQAMDMHQKILQHNIDTMKNVNRLKEKNPEMLGRIMEQPLTESIDYEERFRALRQKLEQI